MRIWSRINRRDRFLHAGGEIRITAVWLRAVRSVLVDCAVNMPLRAVDQRRCRRRRARKRIPTITAEFCGVHVLATADRADQHRYPPVNAVNNRLRNYGEDDPYYNVES